MTAQEKKQLQEHIDREHAALALLDDVLRPLESIAKGRGLAFKFLSEVSAFEKDKGSTPKSRERIADTLALFAVLDDCSLTCERYLTATRLIPQFLNRIADLEIENEKLKKSLELHTKVWTEE